MKAIALDRPGASGWRVALSALMLTVALILLLYWETASAMVVIWNRSGTFAHAFVVPPLVLWLVWRKRDDLARLTPRPAPVVLIAMAGVALLWLLGDLVAVNSVTQLALTALLVLSVPAVVGLQVARAITFPLAFLFFAVPIGEFMMPQLMEWTADITVIALRLSGVPVYREGLQFVIPSGNWSVVEACSGVRYLIASLTVGTLFAYLNYQSYARRGVFVIVSILVPILANWLRAYMIVMLGHLSGNRLAVGVDHLIYGWVFFGVIIMLMFAVGAKWSQPDPPRSVAPVTGVPVADVSFWLVAACAVLIAAMPLAAKWRIQGTAAVVYSKIPAPAALAPEWRIAPTDQTVFKPAFTNPVAELNTFYVKADKKVGLYLGFYRNQTYESKLVSSDNVLVTSTDTDWSRVADGARLVRFGQEQAHVRSAELRTLPLSRPESRGRLVAWQIYWINGSLTANDYAAKVYSSIYRLLGRGDDSAVIIVYTEKQQTDSAAVLESFVSENYGAIDALLRRAGMPE